MICPKDVRKSSENMWNKWTRIQKLMRFLHVRVHHSGTSTVRFVNIVFKATIRPDFFGTVSNFDGLSRENDEVFQDAELSRISNPVPILSCFECNVMSHVDKVYTYKPNSYTKFVVVRSILSSSKCTKSIFGRSFTLDPAGGVYNAPPDLLVKKRNVMLSSET